MKNKFTYHTLFRVTMSFAALICLCAVNVQAKTGSSVNKGLIYGNPRVYNVEYSFEMFPDPNKIDRSKDLKLWVPIPREWDSQKAVKIISVEPEPHAKYVDPEHGNPMLFWNFGKEPEKPSYKVNISYRLEQYEVDTDIDPNRIGPYDKTSKDYILYTRSTHTISITDKVKELAKTAVGDEKNPYLQAERILKFVGKKMRFKIHRHKRGVGTKCLLDFPVIDKKTGEEHYEGSCEQYSALFIALCRAAGIPARTVAGFIGWRPWIKEEDLKLYVPIELETSPDGLAAAQHYMALGLHTWAEFYVPNYGWIPADAQTGRLGHLSNTKLIISKGRDVQIGPQAPEKQSEGYGSQWVLIYNGRVDLLRTGVLNIAKIRTATVKILHHSDPFPADAFAGYPTEEEGATQYRKRTLILIDGITRGQPDKKVVLAQAYKKKSRLWFQLQPFICHMLRKVVGDKKFFDIFETYTDLRVKSGEPVSTARFQKLAEDIYGQPLDWFFSQWLRYTELPQLTLNAVMLSKDKNRWYVRGNLRQLNKSLFRLPVELVFETEGPKEHKEIWMGSKNSNFEFSTSNRPKSILVDPNNDILQIRKMPPLLVDFWKVYPSLVVVYGTIAEGEANKAVAESFNKEYLGLDPNIVKADTDVNDADLKGKCLILFGRPHTNKIARKLESLLPIKFDGNKLTWQGKTYDKPSLAVAQIVEGPSDSAALVVHYAGLSVEAMQKFYGNYLSFGTSYVIFDRDKTLLLDDWRLDDDLTWEFDKEKSEH